jgi:hypothetical protein|tara:strand:- start:337 stop:564 length:228 start_codon:yes stop_codon:yes gene_type:complete
MKMHLDRYITRGGTKTALAKACKISDTQITRIGQSDRGLMVEFNPMNPKHILKVWVPEAKIVHPERILYDCNTES